MNGHDFFLYHAKHERTIAMSKHVMTATVALLFVATGIARAGEVAIDRHDKSNPAAGATVVAAAEDATDAAMHEVHMKPSPEPMEAAMPNEVAGLHIDGFVDAYYAYNFNNPDSGLNTLSNFDFQHNDIVLSLAELVVSKDAEPVGFRLDLDFGPTADAVAGAETALKNLQQGYLRWMPHEKFTLDVGKFVTHMGAEVIESKDNWNYTRGLLFSWAIPYYHAGLRAGYSLTDRVMLTGFLYNGWNNVIETNDLKTAGAQLMVMPVDAMTFYLNWVGPENAAGAYRKRHVIDAIAMINPTDMLSLMVNGDYGVQDDLAGAGQTWYGVAAYAKLHQDAWAGIVRYEYTGDPDNVMYALGTATNVQEVTVTGEYTIAEHLLNRLELRTDLADKRIFAKSGTGLSKNQIRVVYGAIVYF